MGNSWQNLILADEALAYFKNKSAKFIDARYYMPNDPRNGRKAYLDGHVPGARYFSLDEVAEDDGNHPHRLPTGEKVAEWLSANGFANDDLIIVYDDEGLFSAPRVWWLLKAIGHEQVKILNGGYKAWSALGIEPEIGEAAIKQTSYKPAISGQLEFVSREGVKQALSSKSHKIVDARSKARFDGTAAEPRAGLPAGHMPGSTNLPFAELLDENGLMKTPAELEKTFASKGLKKDDAVIASCGSGITACVLLLGMEEAGWKGERGLYDGSWLDWASQPDSEIATGES